MVITRVCQFLCLSVGTITQELTKILCLNFVRLFILTNPGLVWSWELRNSVPRSESVWKVSAQVFSLEWQLIQTQVIVRVGGQKLEMYGQKVTGSLKHNLCCNSGLVLNMHAWLLKLTLPSWLLYIEILGSVSVDHMFQLYLLFLSRLERKLRRISETQQRLLI